MARQRGFDPLAGSQNPFDVAINSVVGDINSIFSGGGIGGGKIPQQKRSAMNSSVKMGGPRSSFTDAALGTFGTNKRSLGDMPSVKVMPGGGFSSGGSAFGTNANQSFWQNTIGQFNTTDRLGRQYLESEAKRKADAEANRNNFGSGGDAGSAQTDRVAGALQHKDLLVQVGEESGVPWEVLAATMALETGGINEGVNPAGAQGLMQVVGHYSDGTPLWQSLANQYGGDLSDPYTNVRTAAEIMKMGYDQYGSWEKAAAWYFGGGGAFKDDGSYSINADMYGTDIGTYVNTWSNNFAAVSGQGGSGQGVDASGAGLVFPIKGYQGGVDLHWGTATGAADLFAPEGTDVLAISGGTVNSGYSDIGGYWSYITGDDGLIYYYAHQDRMGPNGRIEKGGYIGGVGETGNAAGTGAHVHLGIATADHGIINGTGPDGGSGNINVAEFLSGTYRY